MESILGSRDGLRDSAVIPGSGELRAGRSWTGGQDDCATSSTGWLLRRCLPAMTFRRLYPGEREGKYSCSSSSSKLRYRVH